MTIHTPLLRSAALGLGLGFLGLAGCDVTDPLKDVEIHVDLSEAPVEIPASVGTVAVIAGQTTATTGTVNNDTDIDRIEELRAIKLLPSYLIFTPAAAVVGANGDIVPLAQSGTLTLLVVLDGHPLFTPVVVTIENDVVTAVEPQSIVIFGATIDVNSIQDLLASLNGISIPLTAGWETMTVDQMVGRINDALVSWSIPLSIVVKASGGLDGTLRLSRISFDAKAVLSQ
ncbi:MAG: hypothetical protein P8099_14615 [Gemmatimonadota bacterium]|jgi:hypothetical protein